MATGSGQPPAGRWTLLGQGGNQAGGMPRARVQGQALATITLLFLSLGTSLCPRSSNKATTVGGVKLGHLERGGEGSGFAEAQEGSTVGLGIWPKSGTKQAGFPDMRADT